jgi:hypothetical protein
MYSQTMIHDWARRLVASEVDTESPSARTEGATLRVYEKLRQKLRAPVGVDGFQALAARALSLAKSQSPKLSTVQVMATGDLSGLSEVELQAGKDEEDVVGIILIAQLLGLFLTLLGEAATVSLIESEPVRIDTKSEMEIPEATIPAAGTSYLGPFEDILLEADQLRNVSERLESLADKHVGIDEVMSVAGSIRNIAAVLDVFTVIRSKPGGLKANALTPPQNGYLN